MELILIGGGIAALIVANALYQRGRERALLQRIDGSGGDPSAAEAAVDEAIAENKANQAFWRRQGGRID